MWIRIHCEDVLARWGTLEVRKEYEVEFVAPRRVVPRRKLQYHRTQYLRVVPRRVVPRRKIRVVPRRQ